MTSKYTGWTDTERLAEAIRVSLLEKFLLDHDHADFVLHKPEFNRFVSETFDVAITLKRFMEKREKG